MHANIFFIFFSLFIVDFHLVLCMLGFRFFLWWKDAWLTSRFYRDRGGFTNSYTSSSFSTSFIETSDSDLVRSMEDMVDDEGVVIESLEKRDRRCQALICQYRGGCPEEM